MTALEVLDKELREKFDMLRDAAARGNCRDFDEYKYTCGQIRGLEFARDIIKALQDNMEAQQNE